MLIHKGNFLKRKSASILLAAALTGFAGPLPPAHGAAIAAPTVRAPEAVAAEFYDWFLATLDADQDPLSDRYERLHAYVAQPLVDQLLARGQGAGDYFLQSSRIRGAWLRAPVRTAVLRRQARTADVLVTLDGGGDAQHDVVLTMALDNGTWKIRSVSRAAVDASESSPGRPGI
ncbi:hypothetical protein NX784_11245 [Massilia pinisoli]|uniref:DUF3828 domain-containing protein n=1 Tax=Massilia pinisoli TaxID=1772194 RepID=A0ABT1ZQH7_9BURK|nr:hypothetical protein [Massilia pinisoli]MCS0582168.1 hypothetical protein [Massilia pinisoli]